MCLVIFAHQVSQEFPLVVAANRDEFHARPTAPSRFWEDQPQLLAGRDLQGGGTWMGVTRDGRFAAVTNYRDPSRTGPAPLSRGELPLHYLSGTVSPAGYLENLATKAGDYAGFNLLLGDSQGLWYLSNSKGEPQRLAPGIYGLSNAALDTPWPKVTLGKKRLEQLLQRQSISHEKLAATVADRALADSRALRIQGLDSSMDEVLSAQFIVTEAYGTRSCTTLWIDSGQQVSWQEQTFDGQGTAGSVTVENFKKT